MKQICFFATAIDIKKIMDELLLPSCEILNNSGHITNLFSFLTSVENAFAGNVMESPLFYFSKKTVDTVRMLEGCNVVDALRSDAVQFHPCMPSPQYVRDISFAIGKYTCNGYTVVRDSEEYSKQISEAMENGCLVENPNYIANGIEHARFYYNSMYYENGEICKSKNAQNIFNSIAKYIKQHYKISKDKFGYIGPDAYQKYLQEVIVPCSGKYRILF